jgi:hypothetical protein
MNVMFDDGSVTAKFPNVINPTIQQNHDLYWKPDVDIGGP